MSDRLSASGGLRLPLRGVTRSIQEFIATEAAGGIFLLVAAIFAIAWANSPWSAVYFDALHSHVVVDLGFYRVDESVHFWINDVLMVVFFFLMGLEIKRELAVGELNSLRRAVAPLAAAAGGLLVPAAVFLLLVDGPDARAGWGVPIATDIAFALGIAALLGPRVPIGVKVLLLAIAIFDDLGAVAIVALVYAGDLDGRALLVAGALLGLTYGVNRLGVRQIPVYLVIGVAIWVAVAESGVHPTTVGVALGLLTPWRPWSEPSRFVAEARQILRSPEAESVAQGDGLHTHALSELVSKLRRLGTRSIGPLDRLEHELAPWVAFLVVPLFALGNAGVDLRGDTLPLALSSGVTWGVAAGLAIGKPVGIMAGTWVAVKLGAELPDGVTWAGVLGIGAVAGVGFTVALFVAQLAYPTEGLLASAKVGIFIGSIASGVAGYLLLRRSASVNARRL